MVDICIDRVIGNQAGEISAAFVKSQLPLNGRDPITVRIHSEGGSVFEGLAMFDALKAYPGPKKCIVESSAFSMASVVAMAFPDRQITENGYMMLHSPYMESNDKTPPVLESLRQRLVSIYTAGTRRSKQAIEAMMTAETFLDAAECLKAGFATAISGTTARAVASFQSMVKSNSRFRSAIVAKLKDDATKPASERWNAAYKTEMVATRNDASKALREVDRKFPGLRDQMISDANKR